jgi:hypothetical protein
MPFGEGHLWFGKIVRPKGALTKAKDLQKAREKGNLDPLPTTGQAEIVMRALP